MKMKRYCPSLQKAEAREGWDFFLTNHTGKTRENKVLEEETRDMYNTNMFTHEGILQ